MRRYASVPTAFLLSTMLLAGCGGGGGDGDAAGDAATVTITGAAVLDDAGAGGTVVVQARSRSGRVYEVEADRADGQFTLHVSPDDDLLIGFMHRDDGAGGTHFAGFMVFACGTGDTDRFRVTDRERDMDLGLMNVHDDGTFTRPERGPFDDIDSDGDGIADARDPDAPCLPLEDDDRDGFYDDDFDRDGHHDDDADRDGFHDDDRDRDGAHDDDMQGGMRTTP